MRFSERRRRAPEPERASAKEPGASAKASRFFGSAGERRRVERRGAEERRSSRKKRALL
jgi:hypothetical protein